MPFDIEWRQNRFSIDCTAIFFYNDDICKPSIRAACTGKEEDDSMMKRGLWLLILALSIALTAPLSLAENADYVPGETMQALIGDAFNAGKMVGGDLHLYFDMNMDILAPGQEDARAVIDGIMQVLDASTLRMGVGKIDDGLRIELSGVYTPSAAEAIAMTAAIDLTKDGVRLESNLIEGRRVSARWETLLALGGMTQDQIAQIMTLRELDFEALTAQMLATLQEFADAAAQIATPYVATVTDFVASLPVVQKDNVAADGLFPAVDHELLVTMTDEDLSRLIIALADQLESDAMLAPLLDGMLFSSADQSVTTAQLCGMIRESAKTLASQDGVYSLVLGWCEDTPVFHILFNCIDGNDNGMNAAFIFDVDETLNAFDATFSVAKSDAEGNAGDSMLLTLAATVAPNDPMTQDIDMFLSIAEGEETFTADYVLSFSPMTTDQNLPGYEGVYTINAVSEPSGDRAMFDMLMRYALTKDGGEMYTISGTADVYEAGEDVSLTLDGGISISPAEGGFTGRYWISESAKQLGLDHVGIDIALSSWEHDSAASRALTTLTLETVSVEEMDALATDFSVALEDTLNALIGALPPQVLALMAE